MNNQRSGDLKLGRKERFAELPTEMKEKIGSSYLEISWVKSGLSA
jgi:hypothetical protein